MSGTPEQEEVKALTVSRRDFLKFSGMAIVGIYVGGCDLAGGKPTATWGFLLVDMKKCQGCISCMLACSLVHEGEENLSLSRIQIQQDPYGRYPDDLRIIQCRQCVEPACLAACPTGALHRDPDYGDVTTVDIEKCIGCQRCIKACPYTPGRAVWNAEGKHSQKCDLCSNAPYWHEKGGPDGKKACVEICPLKAIMFSKVIPDQNSEESYAVNLRDLEWGKLGYPIF